MENINRILIILLITFTTFTSYAQHLLGKTYKIEHSKMSNSTNEYTLKDTYTLQYYVFFFDNRVEVKDPGNSIFYIDDIISQDKAIAQPYSIWNGYDKDAKSIIVSVKFMSDEVTTVTVVYNKTSDMMRYYIRNE